MKFAITMCTYYRADGNSSSYLKRALDSIANQTYQEYKIFLIGDKYEKNDEFENICKSFPYPEKIFYTNLSEAKERDYFTDKMLVWKFGGVNAINIAIDKSIEEGFNYICHLDHDDYYSTDHLETIKKAFEDTNCSWLCTHATYRNNVLPKISSINPYVDYYPQEGNVAHSSTCVNFKDLPIKYQTYTKGDPLTCSPSDGLMWKDISHISKEKKLKCIFVNKITCHVEDDGFYLK